MRSDFPDNYTVFQVEGDSAWYAGCIVRADDDETPAAFEPILRVDRALVRFETREEAERACGYDAMGRLMTIPAEWEGD